MKTQVTLNAYGGVVVAENNTTTIHSKETALQIYEVVKADFEKPKLEVGRWYERNFPNYGVLFCFNGEYDQDGYACGYGFVEGEFIENEPNNGWGNKQQTDFTPAPTETVETALRNEFIRLGWKEGMLIKTIEGYDSTWLLKGNIEFVFDSENNKLKLFSDYGLDIDRGDEQNNRDDITVFHNGKFATIIKPETISIQEAEKRTVFVVRHKDTGNDFGTFSTKEKAEKYIATSSNFTIVENTVD